MNDWASNGVINGELTAAVIGAVVGGIVAYAGGWIQEVRTRRRRREAAASVLLFQLRIIDHVMTEVLSAESPSSMAAGPSPPMIDFLLGELVVFKPGTVEAVLIVLGFNSDVVSRLRLQGEGLLQAGADADGQLKLMARAALAAMPAAYTALTSEGGKEPSTRIRTAGEIQNQQLPPSPFHPRQT
jgi:hypothetical protein